MSNLASLSLWGDHLLHGKGAGYLNSPEDRGWVPLDNESKQREACQPGSREVGAAKVKAGVWGWGLPSIPSSWASCQAVE